MQKGFASYSAPPFLQAIVGSPGSEDNGLKVSKSFLQISTHYYYMYQPCIDHARAHVMTQHAVAMYPIEQYVMVQH